MIELNFDEEMKYVFMKWYAERIADEFLIYNKYKDLSKENYLFIANGALDETKLTNDERNQVISNSKSILKDRYNIEILCDEPIVLKYIETEED